MTVQTDFTMMASLMQAFAVDSAQLPDEGWEDPAHGSVTWRTLICGDRAQSTGMVAGIATFGAEGTLNAHRHTPPEIYFGLEGAGVVVIDDVVHPIAPGIAVYIPGDCEHRVIAGAEGLRFLYTFPVDRFGQVDYRFSPTVQV